MTKRFRYRLTVFLPAIARLNAFGRTVVLTGLIFALAVFAFKGCAAWQSTSAAPPRAIPDLVWPNPPEIPRIRYLRTIATPEDLAITKSLWLRIWEFIVGPEDERIFKPYGVQADGAGRIYVADSVARVIHVFDVEGKNYRKIGDPQQLKFPIDIALDRKGRIFVSDVDLGSVLRFDSTGRLVGEIGRDGGLKRPAGLVYNPLNDLLYVVDVALHEILVYEPEGSLKQRFGRRGSGVGEFNYPTNITADKKGNLYVTDSLNFRVQLFDSQGRFVSAFGRPGDALGEFSKPKGIALDSEGHIYVVEGLFDTILIYDRQGRLLLNFGGPGNGPGQFWLATGIFIDPSDRIYVADSYNRRIQVFQYLRERKQIP